ncbi:hypothetical protein KQX54_016518 [Cotesia glomerata]|uniref:Uncharacterized protein n=1 Tax=Cotesia glomerata TaxID=32391 RepID=A0AAV7HF87_COTGL|nr:hypothetical protein KQX54_016518 [Cotesia glomerata]
MAAAGYGKTLSVGPVQGLRLIIIKRDETCENEDTFDSEAVFDTELALAANQNDRLPRSEANRARGAGTGKFLGKRRNARRRASLDAGDSGDMTEETRAFSAHLAAGVRIHMWTRMLVTTTSKPCLEDHWSGNQVHIIL